MEPRVNYVIVGLFVVVLTAGLIVGTLWLSVRTWGEYNRYAAFFDESVGGLNVKSPVRYRGVDVGQVAEITLDRERFDRVRLLLDIRTDVPITQDTVATLRSQGLVTGLVYVELAGGTATSPRLEVVAGAPYPVIETRPSLMTRIEAALPALVADLTTIAEDVRQAAQRIARLFSEENRTRLTDVLRQSEAITRGIAKSTGELQSTLEQVARAAADTARASQGLPDIVRRTERALSQAQQALAAVEDAARTIGRVTGGTSGNVEQLLVELQQLTQTLQGLAQDIRQEPNILLFGRTPSPPGPGE